MAISSITTLAGCYFLQNIPDLEWTDLPEAWSGHVVLTIYKDGNEVQRLQEPATAANGKVYFRGVAEVLRSYVEPVTLSQSSFVSNEYAETPVPAVRFVACLIDAGDIDTRPGTFCQAFVVYALCHTPHDPVDDVRFLSRYRDRTIPHDQYILASFYARSGVKLRERLWLVPQAGNITEHVREFPGTVAAPDFPVLLGTYNYSVKALAALGGYSVASPLWMVDLELVNSQNEVVDFIRFRIDHQHHAQLTMVGYTNCFGVPEVEGFIGVADRAETMEGEYGWMDDNYRKLSENLTLERNLKAAISSKEHQASLRDLATAPKVYVIREENHGSFEEVTVTGFSLNLQKPNSAPSVASVTLRNTDRIFDKVTRPAWDAAEDPDTMDGIYGSTL